MDSSESSRCRLCFSDCSSADSAPDVIFPPGGPPNRSLIAMIYECTSIRVSFGRDRSCVVCDQCSQMLQQFHGYRSRCLANERLLRRERGADEDDDDDPLESEDEEEYLGIKTEYDGTDRKSFYRTVKRQIKEFLEAKTKQIERKAMVKVKEAMRNRPGGLESDGEVETDGVDWRDKYLTLQRNNELLQKAFRDQKTKLKQTEQLLRSYKEQHLPNSSQGHFYETTDEDPAGHQAVGGSFTMHPAIPDISEDFLQDLNYNSGPGEKGDRNFVSKLAVAVFGEEVLVNSSVTGRPSNAHHNIPPKPPLCPKKIAAIEAKLYERVEQEVGRSNRSELLQRSSEKVVRLVVCQKSMNLRKQVLKRSQSTGGGGGNGSYGEDDSVEEPSPSAKRRAV